MQAPAEKQLRLLGSRLAWRVLLCTLCVAICLFIVGYIITSSAESRAKQGYINARLHIVTSSLKGLQSKMVKREDGHYQPSELLLGAMRQQILQGHLAYIILLDKNSNIIASAPSAALLFAEADLQRIAERNGSPTVFPAQELVNINGADYLCVTVLLPRTDGLRVVYGLYQAQVQAVGTHAAAMLRAPIWAGLTALFVLCVLCVTLFIGPLLRLFKYVTSHLTGRGTEDIPLVVGRQDELGDFARLVLFLLEKIKELELRPLLGVGEALHTLSPLLERFAHGVLVMEPDGRILFGNQAARQILRQAALQNSPNIFPLVEEILNPKQQREFRHHFDSLPDSPREPLQVVVEDERGVHSYALHLSRHPILHADYILCLIYNVSVEYRLRQVEAKAESRAKKLIQERTEELLKVNEQLRQENAERRTIEQALVRAESRYREIVNNSIEGIFQRSPDGRLLSANASMARILGYTSVEDLLEAYTKPGQRICFTTEMEFAIAELLDIRGWVSNLEFQALMQDNSPVWVAMNARQVADNSGETLYYEAFMEDITSRKKTEEKLVHQAFHDPLTGLPNRALFLDRLRMALRRSKRQSEYLFAVLYLDLNRFKNINDSFGHSAGDKMLNHATEKLLQCVRDVDTVARFGGDEFAVLLADLEKPSQAVLIAKRISAALSESVSFHGQEVSIGASIGIVLNNREYNTPEDILRDADTAMYRAKLHGRRDYTVFNERMREETMAALSLESDLRGAVERGEIEAFYQPLVNIGSGKVHGFEALMRWRRNDSIVSPMVFIPIAEETGIIYDLGLEMMKIVCRQVVKWTEVVGHNDFTIHINISSKQLMATRFWRDVQDILLKIGVDPHQLIFEITESVFLDYGSQVISIMNMVRDFGIRFCLDDFGTGFSALSYLRLLPLESLKVDRSFIVDINTDNYSEAILRNLISMGRDLDLKVITEGVDQQTQVDVLRLVGCKYAQGFHFAEPLPAAEAIGFMQEHGCAGNKE